MQERDLNPTKWGRLAGVSEGTIRKYLNGKGGKTLNAATENKLAAAAGVTVPGLYGEDYDSPTVKDVWIKGLVGAGLRVSPWTSGMGEGEGYSRVPWPPGIPVSDDLVAYELRGESMPPFGDGAIIYVRVSDALPGPDLHGRLCIVELECGDMLLKTVRRGYTPGTFNLHSWDGRDVLEDQRLVRGAPVVNIKL